jgi:hypothetical protein
VKGRLIRLTRKGPDKSGYLIFGILFLKEVARGGEQTRVLLISFIFSFSPLYR